MMVDDRSKENVAEKSIQLALEPSLDRSDPLKAAEFAERPASEQTRRA